jgi:hypothetical protein
LTGRHSLQVQNLTRRRSLGAGAKAAEILSKVKGKGFRHEKTKKKRGTYRGAPTPTCAKLLPPATMRTRKGAIRMVSQRAFAAL